MGYEKALRNTARHLLSTYATKGSDSYFDFQNGGKTRYGKCSVTSTLSIISVRKYTVHVKRIYCKRSTIFAVECRIV
jgi:hypothetical protein